ncbi:MerR family transcriptional regulator [Hydrogenophaga sp.]|uniref:MerR family transcriptional regulator n=1 Tax=Hydrogenophaga sp. TaxID=1904254 RepID=UPI002FC70A24
MATRKIPTSPDARSLLAAEAARRLGVSVKALRLYEQRGLLQPTRTDAGYRCYGPADIRAAQDVVALRSLGLGVAQIAKVMKGDASATDQALALREAELSQQFSDMQRASERLRELRRGLAHGLRPRAGELADVIEAQGATVSFELPWPWGGESFALSDVRSLTYLVGPLGSGKTRLAQLLSQALRNGHFLDLQRLDDPDQFLGDLGLTQDEVAMVESHLVWLREEGAVDDMPLRVVLSALEAQGGQRAVVIDMIEEGLTRPSQEALMSLLRRRLRTRAAPMVAMTRSLSILDLALVGPGEAILYCPANHSTPFVVPPFLGAIGHEALVSCLATPEVRERVTRMRA